MVKELLFDKFESMYGHMVNPMIGNVNTNSMVHLFATKGRRWKRLRHIANPAFSTFNLKRALPIIDDTIQNNIKILKNTYLPGNYLNIVDYFTELTFDVIYRLAMGKKDSKEFCQLSRDTLTVFNNNIFDYLSYIFPWLGLNVLSPFLGATGNLRRDPGQILIEKIYEANERRNSIDEIVMNLFLFLLTGFDTTANTLSLIAHNLVFYPEVQKRLFEEIEEICGLEEGEIINYEQLAKLKYVDAVFYETQRLCPMAAAVVNRVCEETTTLGDITIEKGTVVSADLFTLHRDKKIWGEDAEEFKPERWLLNENINAPTEYYYPFGGGPRICIGMKLGMMEIKMVELNFSGQVVLNPETITIQLKSRQRI
uniref:Cytochrome P450 n=1 Tax=Meloidogyne javanica TaxID=6303 RepID=A0A915M2T4_MELJA